MGCSISSHDLTDSRLVAIVEHQFGCLIADNEMMPALLVDDTGHYDFTRADKIAQFAQDHRMVFIGHMLVWQHISRNWLFKDDSGQPLPREKALENMRNYIETVARHFRGKVAAWDVVNEALSDNPEEYLRDTPARRSIGDDFIEKAFEFAHAADPTAKLFYNDYNIEEPIKRAKALKLLRSLRAKNLRVDAVGIQGHWALTYPPASMVDDAIRDFHEAGFDVMITELDVDVLPRTTSGADLAAVENGPNPYPEGLPDHLQQQLAARYRELFEAILKPPSVSMINFWGPDDGRSWLNDFPVKHRTNYPLLFDRNAAPKPAFDAVMNVLTSAKRK